MEFLSSREFLISLLIEAGILLFIATGTILFLLLRLSRRRTPPASATLLDHLRAEIEKTREKQAQLGSNGYEARQLQTACDLRCQVLEGEIQVLESANADDRHYWRPVLDYYETVRDHFAKRTKNLEERLAVCLQRIENLEVFKEKLFDLRERLNRSYQNNCRLEKELREKIKQGAKLSELEHTLSQMEREKEDLQKELQLAEHEFMVIMENAASGTTQVPDLAIDVPMLNLAKTHSEALNARLKEAREENEFLCKQIQALLTQEVNQESRLKTMEENYLELERRYARMEERYLTLQAEVDG